MRTIPNVRGKLSLFISIRKTTVLIGISTVTAFNINLHLSIKYVFRNVCILVQLLHLFEECECRLDFYSLLIILLS